MRLSNLSQKCFESNTKCGECDKKDAATRLAVRGEGSPGRGKLSPKVTDEGVPIAAVCLHPHPALRATFPRLGEGFYSGKLSAKSKNVYNKSC